MTSLREFAEEETLLENAFSPPDKHKGKGACLDSGIAI